MKPFVLMSAAAMSLLVLSAAPAAAQSFVAEVDCGGVVAPGDTVPVTVRLESQSQQSIKLDIVLELQIPGVGPRTKTTTVTLAANQDASRTLQLHLPLRAPAGEYQGSVTATSDSEMSFDTCSFKVQR